MSQALLQPSFAAGELAPSLYARTDLAKYHVGAKLLRNVMVQAHGGAANRAGTQFVGRCKDSANPVRVIRFQFNTSQAYALEFGHLYMRVIMNGGYVLEPSKAITAVTQASPGVLSVAAHGYANGDQVFIAAATGMTQINSTPGRQFLVTGAAVNTFTLTDLDGAPVNTAGWPAYAGGGTVARVYTMSTPYQGADLALLKYTQSADTLTLCHPGYTPSDLTRTQHWAWQLTPITFAPSIPAPTHAIASPSGGGSFYYGYIVTAQASNPPDESRGSTPALCSNAELNQNSGVQNIVSWQGLATADNYRIYKANPLVSAAIPAGAMYGYIGQTAGTTFIDTNISPDFTQTPPQGTNPFNANSIGSVTVSNGGASYSLNPQITVQDVTGYGAILAAQTSAGRITGITVVNGGSSYTAPILLVTDGGGSGAILALQTSQITVDPPLGSSPDTPSTTTLVISGVTILRNGGGYANPTAVISDTSPTDIYGTVSPPGSGAVIALTVAYGVIASATVLSTGSGYNAPSVAVVDSTGHGAVLTPVLKISSNNPGVAGYYEQRKIFGASTAQPQTFWATQPGDYRNMDVSDPVVDSDAITVSIAAQEVNAIRWFVPLNSLLVMTSGGAWKVNAGSGSNVLTPTQTVVTPQAYTGCADVQPIIINYDILYVQAKGSVVRDLAYNFYADVFTGSDMSVLSNHLFFGYQITEWAYAEEPWKIVWAVRNDGQLLSFTYLKEQDVYAWSHSDSFGNSGTDRFLSAVSISEPPEDAVYFVVERTIPGVNGGQPVKYVERLHSRNFLNAAWQPDVTLAWFVDCGLQYVGAPTTLVTGLDHLDGCTVAILADGFVPPQQVVAGGQITLTTPASRVTVGLPYTAQVITLPIDAGGPTTVQGKRKKLSAVTLRVQDSRGIKVGQPNGPLRTVREPPPAQGWGTVLPLFTGDERQVLDPSWTADGSILIQQDNPLPMTVLGVIPEIQMGDTPA